MTPIKYLFKLLLKIDDKTNYQSCIWHCAFQTRFWSFWWGYLWGVWNLCYLGLLRGRFWRFWLDFLTSSRWWSGLRFFYIKKFCFKYLQLLFLSKLVLNNLILILLELKEIRLCHQYGARPAYMSMQSDQALYCWLTNFKFSSWYPSKYNGQFKKRKMDYSIWEIQQVII